MKDTVYGREAEWLSVSFVAGAAAGAIALRGIGNGASRFAAASAAASAAVCLLAFMAAKGRRRSFPAAAGFWGIAVAAFACGLFCVLNDALPGVGPARPPGMLRRTASAAAGYLQGVISRIPFPDPHTEPLLRAIILGDRSLLDADTVRSFRDSGSSHLLALSGLHMGVIYVIFTRLAAFTGNFPVARTIRYAVTVALSAFYTIMTGSSPSTVRAFLFILMNESLRILGRRRSALKVLCASLTLQLAARPSSIASAGFQLSYLAMAGIFILHPPLSALYRGGRWDPMKKAWDAATLALSCQIATAPAAWLHFRSFPAYFLIANMTAVPVTTIFVAVSVLTIALSAAGLCPYALVRADGAIASLLLRIVETIGSM